MIVSQKKMLPICLPFIGCDASTANTCAIMPPNAQNWIVEKPTETMSSWKTAEKLFFGGRCLKKQKKTFVQENDRKSHRAAGPALEEGLVHVLEEKVFDGEVPKRCVCVC